MKKKILTDFEMFILSNYDLDADENVVATSADVPRIRKEGFGGSKNRYRTMGVTWKGKRHAIYLHRLKWLLAYGWLPTGEIDHIDRDPSNNALSNLRAATASQQQANRAPLRGFKGVQKAKNRWRVAVKADGVVIWLGYFDDPVEAARQADRAYLAAFGEFAYTNFPRSDYSASEIEDFRRKHAKAFS